MERDIFTLAFEEYDTQKSIWPRSGRQIIGHYNDSYIVVYQAYCQEIADPAVVNQDFITDNPNFLPVRMTWIKPNFLWMMFRSDWATKKNQERILAFHVHRSWFEECILEAGLSGADKNCRNRNVVVQWDPDHSPSGGKHPNRKDIQIGIRKIRSDQWAQGIKGPAIGKITDITEFVHQENLTRKQTGNFNMPVERVYPFEAKNIELSREIQEKEHSKEDDCEQ